MPVMDGFAATAAIRALEKMSSRHLPIVAMTARAMKGDRECCLAAGMDGYISKPINPKELLTLVDTMSAQNQTGRNEMENYRRVERSSATSASSSYATNTGSTNRHQENADVVNLRALMERVENDTALLAEMLELYQESSPRLVSEIETGVRAGDVQIVQHAAHSLKGALQNLSATASADAALNLEKMTRSGTLYGAEQLLTELKEELQRLDLALNDWSKGQCV
jgi:two-component system sensor histidine kinase/response regulator